MHHILFSSYDLVNAFCQKQSFCSSILRAEVCSSLADRALSVTECYKPVLQSCRSSISTPQTHKLPDQLAFALFTAVLPPLS